MRLLDRYLLRELLQPLGYCLSGFLLLWIASDLLASLGDFQGHNMQLGDIALYYLVKTPGMLVIVLPIAILLALLYALTNHARNHEITAIRAAGISLGRLCLPYLVVGILSSAALFALNEFWVPDSDEAAEQIKARRQPPVPGAPGPNEVRNLTFNNSRAGRAWRIGVYNTATGEMLNPQVMCAQPNGWQLWVYGDRAVRTNDMWLFYNVREYKVVAETNVVPVLLLQTNLLAMPQFSETPEEIRSEIKISDGISLRRAKRPDVPVTEILNYLRLHPNPSTSEGAAWLYTKLHGRLAAPWACLVVVVVAVPFGAASGRRNVFVGVASSILIVFVYYVLQQVCLALGTGGHMPPWLAGWFPNLAFGLTGMWLTTRVR
jgi:lipopolysaccharide export system permease protein